MSHNGIKNLVVYTLFIVVLIFLVGCGSQDTEVSDSSGNTVSAPSGAKGITGNSVANLPYTCRDLVALERKIALKNERLEAENKQLIGEVGKVSETQLRVQQFKVLKLDREIEELNTELAKLQKKCD